MVVELNIDDGAGSGPSTIEWSSDNATWNEYPDDGLILWNDWNNTHLFVKVTDGANLFVISELEIEIPAEETETNNESEDIENPSSSSGGVSTMLALLVVLAIIGLSVFTVILAIRLRARSEIEDELEGEQEETEVSEIPDVVEEQPTTYHVPDHTHLIGGGEYDQSTGHMAYIDPDGRWWWQQEDGSFYHDPALNASDATQDDLP